MSQEIKKSFTAVDFKLDTDRANISKITLAGRYPESGYALNTISEMIVYVLDGKVLFKQGAQEKFLKKIQLFL